MPFDRLKPYQTLPSLPPKADVESKAVLRKALTASRALAELKGLGHTIPNQSILINSLVLQEARASSEIENILTTNDVLFKAFSVATPEADPQTKEVLRYREAVWSSFERYRKRPLLTTNLFAEIARTIKGHEEGIRKAPGTRILNTRNHRVIYTPPDGEATIRKKLKELEDFIHSPSTLDPLVRMALVHYQFEAIHPFADGNGRTGRILNILFLIQQGLLELPVLYLSRYIIRNKNDYYRLLKNVTEKSDWEPWIRYMLQAVEETSIFTRRQIIAIRNLMTDTSDMIRDKLPERLATKELVEIIFRQPYTKIQFLVDANIAGRQTAAEYLRKLEDIGILRSQKIGKENLFLNIRLFKLLNT